MSTKAQTLQTFDILNQQKNNLVESLKKYLPAQLNTSFEQNQWSVAQVISHLAIAESLSKKYLDKKIANKQHTNEMGIMSGLRRNLINTILKLPLRYKLPIAALNPTDSITFDLALEEWNAIRNHYRLDLEKLDESFFNRDLFLHPLVGKMKLNDAFLFMYEHTAHHEKQIARIISNPNFIKK